MQAYLAPLYCISSANVGAINHATVGLRLCLSLSLICTELNRWPSSAEIVFLARGATVRGVVCTSTGGGFSTPPVVSLFVRSVVVRLKIEN